MLSIWADCSSTIGSILEKFFSNSTTRNSKASIRAVLDLPRLVMWVRCSSRPRLCSSTRTSLSEPIVGA
uniref:Uncharacterized protein n=1 Tax=Rhizophora mucronata TaxID=61149 RepID=A0A2P2J734_RHIMU